MGARSDVQTGIAAEMDGELADAVEAFEVTRTTTGSYDPAAGTITDTIETFTGRWIRDEWSRQELDSQHIQSTDLKRVVLQNETTWQPAVDDVVDGYKVLDFQQDGFEATWVVQLRKT